MKIDRRIAERVLREEAKAATKSGCDPFWVEQVETLGRLCSEGNVMTHIAFLGTSMLAKSIASEVDLYAVKPKHAHDNPNAYSARSLAHGVLVPVAVDLDIDLGVSGREPLNNQPYFRMEQLDDGTPVHSSGKAAFAHLLEMVGRLSKLRRQADARAALRAFLYVRRRVQQRYRDTPSGAVAVSERELVNAIVHLLEADSEGGRRAQAVVAGLLDVYAGPNRVASGWVNDPSRHYPGDVVVYSANNAEQVEKAFEVRDKPISDSDARIFARKCAEMGVTDAAIVAVNTKQTHLREDDLGDWAASRGVGLSYFSSWTELVRQVLFWSQVPVPVGCTSAVSFIRQRLIAALVAPKTVDLWDQLSRK